jgi:hypothetical protein
MVQFLGRMARPAIFPRSNRRHKPDSARPFVYVSCFLFAGQCRSTDNLLQKHYRCDGNVAIRSADSPNSETTMLAVFGGGDKVVIRSLQILLSYGGQYHTLLLRGEERFA